MALVDKPPYGPFWAITKHADIMEIERANTLWINEPRPLLATAAADEMAAAAAATAAGDAQSWLQAGGGFRRLAPLRRRLRRRTRAQRSLAHHELSA